MNYWEAIVRELIVGIVVGTIALYLAARIAKIDNATIIKAFMIASADEIVGGILFYSNPGEFMSIAWILSCIVVWILIIVLIKVLYKTTWLKTFIAWILFMVLYYVFYFVYSVILRAFL